MMRCERSLWRLDGVGLCVLCSSTYARRARNRIFSARTTNTKTVTYQALDLAQPSLRRQSRYEEEASASRAARMSFIAVSRQSMKPCESRPYDMTCARQPSSRMP